MNSIFRFFERFADPFNQPDPGRPPASGLGFIRHFAGQMRGAFWAMLIFGCLEAFAEIALFTCIGLLVDMMAGSTPATFFSENQTVLIAMAVFVIFVRTLISTGTAIIEEQIVVPGFFTGVRWQSHLAVSRQDVGFFDDELSGRVSNKVWQAGQAAGDFMVSLLQIIWFIAVFSATTLVVTAGLDWRIMGLIGVWLVCVGLIARSFVPRIRDRGRKLAEEASGVTGRMVDGYSNTRLVKLYGAEEANDAYVHAGWVTLQESLKRFTRIVSMMRISFRWLSGLMLVLITGAALWLYSTTELTPGQVAIVLALCVRLNLLMGRLLGLLNGLFRNFGTVQNSAELIAQKPKIVDAQSATEMTRPSGHVVFDNVTFAYNEGADVIDKLTLDIRPGQRVGIVGHSGAGKSTLMNLLLRFNDIDSGAITIDGRNISEVTQVSLRRQFGLVAQETSLLHRSIRDNIAFGRQGASQADIEEAARRSKAHDFIMELRDSKGRAGYDTLVGERGVKLSGGQRQRIAIARVFLRDAPILLLDEATSALDSEVEAAIHEHLIELMAGKTVIAIAHRLSTIAHLERLIVMVGGKIVEDGDHQSLMAKGGTYARLWERQTGGYLKVG